MTEMKVTQKLLVLLPHWIEHNAEHATEFCVWAESATEPGQENSANGIRLAAGHLLKANEALTVVLAELNNTEDVR